MLLKSEFVSKQLVFAILAWHFNQQRKCAVSFWLPIKSSTWAVTFTVCSAQKWNTHTKNLRAHLARCHSNVYYCQKCMLNEQIPTSSLWNKFTPHSYLNRHSQIQNNPYAAFVSYQIKVIWSWEKLPLLGGNLGQIPKCSWWTVFCL